MQKNAEGQEKMENEMLKAFYEAWVQLHSAPRENKPLMEALAQNLVDMHHQIQESRKVQ